MVLQAFDGPIIRESTSLPGGYTPPSVGDPRGRTRACVFFPNDVEVLGSLCHTMKAWYALTVAAKAGGCGWSRVRRAGFTGVVTFIRRRSEVVRAWRAVQRPLQFSRAAGVADHGDYMIEGERANTVTVL